MDIMNVFAFRYEYVYLTYPYHGYVTANLMIEDVKFSVVSIIFSFFFAFVWFLCLMIFQWIAYIRIYAHFKPFTLI